MRTFFFLRNLIPTPTDCIRICAVLTRKRKKWRCERGKGGKGNLEELAGGVPAVEASPGLRGRLRRRRGGSRGERGEVVGEGRVGFHLRPEVFPFEVVAVVLRLRLRLRLVLGVLPFATSFHGKHRLSSLPNFCTAFTEVWTHLSRRRAEESHLARRQARSDEARRSKRWPAGQARTAGWPGEEQGGAEGQGPCAGRLASVVGWEPSGLIGLVDPCGRKIHAQSCSQAAWAQLNARPHGHPIMVRHRHLLPTYTC